MMKPVVAIILMLCTCFQAKKFANKIDFSTLNETDCVYVGKYGSESGKYGLEINHHTYGVFASERQNLNQSLTFSIKLVILDGEKNKEAKKLLQDGQKEIYQRLGGKNLPQIDVDLMSDGIFYTSFKQEETGIHYFYFCDGLKMVKKYMKEDAAEKEAQEEDPGLGGIFSNLLGGIFRMRATTFDYKIDITTVDESNRRYHHSIEQRQTDKICLVFFFLFAYLIVYLGKKIRKYYNDNEKVDYPLLLIALSVILQNFSLIFKFIHFWMVSSSGEESHGLDIGSRMWNLFSDMVLSTLLIMMSKGFGVVEVDFISDYIAEFAIGIAILAFRYIWVFLGLILKRDDDEVFHIYDGVTGILELLNTIVLFVWFISSLNLVKIFKSSKFANLRMQLAAYGSIYLCLSPVLILLVYFLDPMHQHQLSTFIALASQLIVCSMMAISFTNKKGVYMNISLSNSLELIGNTKLN